MKIPTTSINFYGDPGSLYQTLSCLLALSDPTCSGLVCNSFLCVPCRQNLELNAIYPGYITDGDNHIWIGDKRILHDLSKLKNLQNLTSSLGKCIRSMDDDGDL